MSANILQATEKIAALEVALANEQPNYAILLKEIHKQLSEDPDCVTLLTEEQIAILVSGLEKKVGVDLIAAMPKPKTKAVKNLSEDDLF
jgi:hypothetical protein